MAEAVTNQEIPTSTQTTQSESETAAVPQRPAPRVAKPVIVDPAPEKPRVQTVRRFVHHGAEDTGETVEFTLRDGVKFVRDQGNFDRDGNPAYREFDDKWTEDICPNSPIDERTGQLTHDHCEIIPGSVGNKKLVQCPFCHTQFASKEDLKPAATEAEAK